MFENKTIKIIFFIITGTIIATYFSGLFIDVTRDAGKYATVSKEIFENGNFINLTVHGDAYDQKPPLLFWLGALGFYIGGISNFWFKFPILILIFFGFYSAYRLGKSLYNKRVGILTSILLIFSLVYTLYSMDIHTDTPLQVFVTFSLWQFSEFIQTKKNRNYILGFIGVGLGMLCKGPIGAVIPAFAVIGHLLLKKNFKAFTDYRWYIGILISFIIVSPALIGLANQFGWQGIIFFFWDNNVGRVIGTYTNLNNDPIFYLHTLLYLFLPWCLLFFSATYLEIKTLIKNKFKTSEYFTFTGIWIFFIILNASRSQLPNYIFSIIPLMGVLTAKWIDIALTQKPKLLKYFSSLQTSVVILLWIFILIVTTYLFPTPKIVTLIILLFGIFSTIYIYIKTKKSITRILLPSIIAFTCLAFTLNIDVFPFIFNHQAPPRAARFFSSNASPGDILYNYNYSQYELFFYSNPTAKQIHSEEELMLIFQKEGVWIFTDDKGYKKMKEMSLISSKNTIHKYKHLYLNKGGRFINPKTRDKVLKPMYLIKY